MIGSPARTGVLPAPAPPNRSSVYSPPASWDAGWEAFERDILPLVPDRIRLGILASLPRGMAVNELRLRAGLPVCAVLPARDILFDGSGPSVPCLIATGEEIGRTLSLVSDCSYYALESEFANGYITIPGGHRVGLTGQAAVWADGTVRIRDVSGLSFRIARAVKGAGARLARELAGSYGRLASTLIVSPPGAGKTTLLRDLCRISGEGMPEAGIRPSQVGIVDERSEIAACYGGIPQHDVGPRADVLDRCPKARGIMMVMRSMGPEVIATDELGGEEDARAVAAAISGGAVVLATCHGNDLEQVRKRPYSRWLLSEGYFDKAVVLSRRKGPGTVEYAGDLPRT
ncbi:MAG TPA: stage III sporulation protein AA [Firmicutes bacterium]|nr:stage III sporulation protein AA [Candidatus Fermentithermobacillaceae bacterium]